MDRCNSVRLNGAEKVNLTPEIKEQIMEVIQRYGTGEQLWGVCGKGWVYCKECC